MILSFWGKDIRTICFLLCLWVLSPGVFSQEAAGIQAVPDVLRRPDRGEARRYPYDLVIGELGQGRTSEGAYLFARNLLSAVTAGNKLSPVLAEAGSVLTENLWEKITNIKARTYRLGGGRTELDGSVSFLVRFIGQTESISGELFLRSEQDSAGGRKWFLDDLLIEEKRALSGIKDSYRYDFSPYERFY